MIALNGFGFGTCILQILNRTNNIFELVTVEPVPDRLENHNKDILGSDIEGDEHRNLRLKGTHTYTHIY